MSLAACGQVQPYGAYDAVRVFVNVALVRSTLDPYTKLRLIERIRYLEGAIHQRSFPRNRLRDVPKSYHHLQGWCMLCGCKFFLASNTNGWLYKRLFKYLTHLQDGTTPYKVSPQRTPGYIYIYVEDDLPHFCWRPRTAPSNQPTIDLIMLPGDGNFRPYEGKGSDSSAPTNGRICVLRFSSSSARHLFWLQSKSQHPSGNTSWFSPRDLKLVQIVDKLIQGEEVNVQEEIADLPEGGGDDGDDDATMEDADNAGFGSDLQQATSGGAGADATGGDFREEGEESREGGADGGRA